jgi:hypothetical protein
MVVIDYPGRNWRCTGIAGSEGGLLPEGVTAGIEQDHRARQAKGRTEFSIRRDVRSGPLEEMAGTRFFLRFSSVMEGLDGRVNFT